jgi:hypothetical protein
MTALESIPSSLLIADDWHRKHQPTWESQCLSSALMGYLRIAVTERTEPDGAIAWLKEQNILDVLRRHQFTLQELAAEVESGRLPNSVIAGNYQKLVFAHLAWCLEEYRLGEFYVAFSKRPDVIELSTRFWSEYASGMGALVVGEPYRPLEIPLRGQERYWVAYLTLIQAASSQQPLDASRIEIEKLFIKRNADKRIKDDSYQIEGSASHRVQWDFRFHSILKYIARKK